MADRSAVYSSDTTAEGQAAQERNELVCTSSLLMALFKPFKIPRDQLCQL